MAVDAHKETLGFQAEVRQLLDLMIHSLYSNKEIFLRELISNASDAIDYLRFAALSEASLYENDSDFKIRIGYDKNARTITVSDNGIGMTRDEVAENIGTIARSGTREFFQSLTGDQQKDAALIGQFGVGFYSSFVVADKVTLITRKAGLNHDQGVLWESNGEGEYTLETIEKPTRGTDVILHLRPDEDELLDSYRLRSIIRKFSDHITLPIVMKTEKEGKEEDEVVNQASALWTRPKSEITEEQYNEFYKHITHDFNDPLAYVHSRMEGTHEYTLLLYIPSRAPFDLWMREHQHGVKLYVRRVFIMDDAEKLMPHYLRFVRGVIDSSDLPLNVSRELLQHNRLIEAIRMLQDRSVSASLDLYGDGPERQALSRKADELGIGDRVHFHGYVARWFELACDHDVFINLSDTEGFCIVVAEAMLAGLPVIATDVGGIRDYGKDGGNMLKLAVPSAEMAVTKALLFAGDKTLRKKTGMQARQNMLQAYSPGALRVRATAVLGGGM